MNKFFRHLEKAGINGFFLCLILMVVLAWLFPSFGVEESILPLKNITTYGISLIFFFYGLRLSPEKLRAGLNNWKLHTLIQTTTFVLFPVIVLSISALFSDASTRIWWTGVFYLAALPSTVSSSVVMVSIAGGNMPAAIFNASISSIIGIFITPVWVGLFIKTTGNTVELGDVILKLCLQVLAPVVLGVVLHKVLGNFAEKYKTWLRYFDQSIILLIVYTAFCESFAGHMFSNHALSEILILAASMLLFFLVMAVIMHFISLWLKFSLQDRITVLFCGSKKSLVQGAVMGKVLFPDPLVLGVMLLPLMLYHALQLLAGSAIAERIAQQNQEKQNE